ncbi:hypothetical protein COOONC_20842 [Cooperia oncophora]
MFGRRKVAPFCAIIGVWALVTLYFFGRSGPLPTSHSLLKDDEPVAKELSPNVANIKLQDINNDFNVDEYKKSVFPGLFQVENDFDDHKMGEEDVKELNNKLDDEMKAEIDKMEKEDQQRELVMPAAVIVPIDDREPEVDLEKLAVINSPEEEAIQAISVELSLNKKLGVILSSCWQFIAQQNLHEERIELLNSEGFLELPTT